MYPNRSSNKFVLIRSLLSSVSLRMTGLGSEGGGSIVHDRIFTFANQITLARAITAASSIWLMVEKHLWLAAFGCMWLAAVLDGLDGFVARRLNQVSRLGTLLDPAVDKSLMATIAFALVYEKVIPTWLFVAILSREMIVVTLGVVDVIKGERIAVSVTGKIATMILFVTLPVFILRKSTLLDSLWIHVLALGASVLGLALYYWSLIGYVRTTFGRSRVK
jgi:cardiolipin synthase